MHQFVYVPKCRYQVLVQDYLQDILDAMDKAEDFAFGMDLNTFRIDDKTAFAGIRNLEIIGEAAKKIRPINDALSQIFLGRVYPGCGTN